MADLESRPAEPRGFRLMRDFTITTLLAFVAMALVLRVLQCGEET